MKDLTFLSFFAMTCTFAVAAGLCDHVGDRDSVAFGEALLRGGHEVTSRGRSLNKRSYVRVGRSTHDFETHLDRHQQFNQQQQQPPPSSQRSSQSLYEERKRREQMHLFSIQQQIWERLGFGAGRRPNQPVHNITEEELAVFEAAMRRAEESNSRTPERVVHPQEYFAKLYQTLPPICRLPRTQSRIWTEDLPPSFRLFFHIEPSTMDTTLRQQHQRETKVDVAELLLKRKPLQRPTTRRGRTASGVAAGNATQSMSPVERIYVSVFAYTKPVRAHRRDSKRVVSTLVLDRYATSTAWIRVDLRTIVEDWMMRPGKNNGLQISVTDADHHAMDAHTVFESYDCGSASSGARSDQPPVLLHIPTGSQGHTGGSESKEHPTRDERNGMVVTYPHLKIITVEVPKAGTRHRRDGTGGASSAGRPPTCVMEKITVSLDELNLSDVIILPRVFETGYCRGSCPLLGADSSRTFPRAWTLRVNSNETSLGGFPSSLRGFQSLEVSAQQANTTTGPPTPTTSPTAAGRTVVGTGSDSGIHECCSPTRLKPLNVLQSNDKGLYIATLDDLIITQCGCRL